MKRISGQVGVEQGSLILFDDFADGGEMWTGTGPREVRRAVVFREAFQGVPVVTLGLSMWDIDHRMNARVEIAAETISALGFEILFRTWGDSRIARVRADWLALGQVRDEDDWEVS